MLCLLWPSDRLRPEALPGVSSFLRRFRPWFFFKDLPTAPTWPRHAKRTWPLECPPTQGLALDCPTAELHTYPSSCISLFRRAGPLGVSRRRGRSPKDGYPLVLLAHISPLDCSPKS